MDALKRMDLINSLLHLRPLTGCQRGETSYHLQLPSDLPDVFDVQALDFVTKRASNINCSLLYACPVHGQGRKQSHSSL